VELPFTEAESEDAAVFKLAFKHNTTNKIYSGLFDFQCDAACELFLGLYDDGYMKGERIPAPL
jgi:hypothetical protein